MKFDPKKPHGVITNHSWAKFEQNGILYDTQGNPMDQIDEDIIEGEEKLPTVNSAERDFSLEQAEAFLTNILADGALARSAVFKECQANNQNWEKIKTAFANMGGEATQRRSVLYWKLKAD